MWMHLLLAVLVIFIGWMIYQGIKSNPQSFSKENLGKSIYTLGVLALILIAFIIFLVVMLKS